MHGRGTGAGRPRLARAGQILDEDELRAVHDQHVFGRLLKLGRLPNLGKETPEPLPPGTRHRQNPSLLDRPFFSEVVPSQVVKEGR